MKIQQFMKVNFRLYDLMVTEEGEGRTEEEEREEERDGIMHR